MTFEESMWLVKKKRWLKAQEAAGYLDFKRERRKSKWYVSEGGREAGTMEFASYEPGEKDCGLCRLFVDRYYTKKMARMSND